MRRKSRPYMDVAQEKLDDIQEKVNRVDTSIKRLQSIVDELIHTIAGAQTLSSRNNWRLLAYNDETFYSELVQNLNVPMFAVAMQREGHAKVIKALQMMEEYNAKASHE